MRTRGRRGLCENPTLSQFSIASLSVSVIFDCNAITTLFTLFSLCELSITSHLHAFFSLRALHALFSLSDFRPCTSSFATDDFLICRQRLRPLLLQLLMLLLLLLSYCCCYVCCCCCQATTEVSLLNPYVQIWKQKN